MESTSKFATWEICHIDTDYFIIWTKGADVATENLLWHKIQVCRKTVCTVPFIKHYFTLCLVLWFQAGARKFPYEMVFCPNYNKTGNDFVLLNIVSLNITSGLRSLWVMWIWRRNTTLIFKSGVGCSPLVFPQTTSTWLWTDQVLHFFSSQEAMTDCSFNMN